MKFTKEDIEMIEKFIEIKNKGFYADGKQVTEVYNRVLEKNVNVTNCGSCLRQRVGELENALKHFKMLSKASNNDEGTIVPPDENKPLTEEERAKLSGFTTVEEYRNEVKAIRRELEEISENNKKVGRPKKVKK